MSDRERIEKLEIKVRGLYVCCSILAICIMLLLFGLWAS